MVEKPAGYQVHTPEYLLLQGKTLQRNNLVRMMRDQLGRDVSPVHRLDRATSGVLVMSLNSDVSRELQKQFHQKTVKKTYVCLVRGWTEEKGVIDSDLTVRLDGGALVEATTLYETIHRFEMPIAIGKHATSRYSLVRVNTLTGRLHQIRRHFKRISHPLVGDTVHGDGKHNQAWRGLVSSPVLFLKSYRIEFVHPVTQENIIRSSRWGRVWHEMFDLAGVCPFIEK